jgi:hypothetical protein
LSVHFQPRISTERNSPRFGIRIAVGDLPGAVAILGLDNDERARRLALLIQ